MSSLMESLQDRRAVMNDVIILVATVLFFLMYANHKSL